MDREELDHLTGQVVDSAIRAHSALGPGLLESAYEACLAHELRARRLGVIRQQPLPVIYRGVRVEVGYRLDLVVEDAVIVELETVPRLLPIHDAQLLSYLRLSGHRVGFLVNFHVPRLRNGIRRMVTTCELLRVLRALCGS